MKEESHGIEVLHKGSRPYCSDSAAASQKIGEISWPKRFNSEVTSCCAPNMSCSPQRHVVKHSGPSCWHYVWRSLVGESGSLRLPPFLFMLSASWLRVASKSPTSAPPSRLSWQNISPRTVRQWTLPSLPMTLAQSCSPSYFLLFVFVLPFLMTMSFSCYTAWFLVKGLDQKAIHLEQTVSSLD